MSRTIHRKFSQKPTAIGLIERVRTSFWFLPALMFGAAIVLAIVTTWIDRGGFIAGQAKTIYDGSPEATHRVLTGIAGSMITIATVTYSIMIVAMSFASGQLGPRLLRNFIRDRTIAINDAFLIGTQRTDAQDLRYPFRQLAEVALRALSPGVNDPYTAITSIDHIGDALAHLSQRQLVKQRVVDDGGNERVLRAVLSYRDLVAEGFDDIRRTASGQVNVTIALLDVLGRVHRGAGHSGCKRVLEDAAQCVLDVTLNDALHAYDRAAVEEAASWLHAPRHILRVG